MKSHYLDQLNDAQKEAVLSKARHTLMIAGPGTGKTHTLTRRIIHTIVEKKSSPTSILAITFTRKAAEQMKDKIAQVCEESGRKIKRSSQPTIGTFHAVCRNMIHSFYHTLGFKDEDISIYDDVDQAFLVAHVAAKLFKGDAAKKYRKEALVALNSIDPHLDTSDEAKTVIANYEGILQVNNALDYGMLISQAIRLLKDYPDALKHYRNLWRYVFVDEYQDTDHRQQELIDLLVGETGELTAVGDVDQAIYTWRLADPQIMLSFEHRYPGSKRVFMGTNYRSVPEIVGAAASLISHNNSRFEIPDQTAARRTLTLEPKPLLFHQTGDQDEEGRVVCDYARQLHKTIGISWGEIMILGRTNSQINRIAGAMSKTAIPYQLVSSKDPWKSLTAKRFMDFMRIAVNKHDSLAFQNLLRWPRPILDDIDIAVAQLRAMTEKVSFLEQLSSAEGHHAGLAGLLNIVRLLSSGATKGLTAASAIELIWNHLADDLGSEGPRHLDEWKATMPPGVLYLSIPGFLRWASTRLLEDSVKDEQDEKVLLTTVHVSKGLERRVVIITGCFDGSFPMTREDSDIEEERRIFYVATTRAKDLLMYTYPLSRTFYQKLMALERSRFLNELCA